VFVGLFSSIIMALLRHLVVVGVEGAQRQHRTEGLGKVLQGCNVSSRSLFR